MLRTLACLLMLAMVAVAQTPSGRHFQRPSRLATAPAAAMAIAPVTPSALAKVARMHTGRSWLRARTTRLPQR